MSIKKAKKFFVSNLQYSQFEQVGWKNRANFMKDKLNINLSKYLEI